MRSDAHYAPRRDRIAAALMVVVIALPSVMRAHVTSSQASSPQPAQSLPPKNVLEFNAQLTSYLEAEAAKVTGAEDYGKATVMGLIATRDMFVANLTQFAADLEAKRQLPREDKLAMMRRLQARAGDFKEAHRKAFLNPGPVLGMTDTVQRVLSGNRREFVRALDRDPLLGLEDDGTHLFDELGSPDLSDDQLLEIADRYLSNTRDAILEEAQEAQGHTDMDDLIEYRTARFSRQRDALHAMGTLKDGQGNVMLESPLPGQLADAGGGVVTNDEYWDAFSDMALSMIAGGFWIIPVYGPWISAGAAAIQIVRDGSDIYVRYLNADEARRTGVVTNPMYVFSEIDRGRIAQRNFFISYMFGSLDINQAMTQARAARPGTGGGAAAADAAGATRQAAPDSGGTAILPTPDIPPAAAGPTGTAILPTPDIPPAAAGPTGTAILPTPDIPPAGAGPTGTAILPTPDMPPGAAAPTGTAILPTPDLPPATALPDRPVTRLDVGDYSELDDVLEVFESERALSEAALGAERVGQMLTGVDLTDPIEVADAAYRMMLARANREGSMIRIPMIEDARGVKVRTRAGDPAERAAADATLAEGRRLAELDARLKTSGLTDADLEWLRSRLAEDPDYFTKLPKRGYVFEEGGRPLYDPQFLLSVEAAEGLENAVRNSLSTGTDAAGAARGSASSARSADALAEAPQRGLGSAITAIPQPAPPATGADPGRRPETSKPVERAAPMPVPGPEHQPMIDEARERIRTDPVLREEAERRRPRPVTGGGAAGTGGTPPSSGDEPARPVAPPAAATPEGAATGTAPRPEGAATDAFPPVSPAGGAPSEDETIGVVPGGFSPAPSVPPIDFHIAPGSGDDDETYVTGDTFTGTIIDLANDTGTGVISTWGGGRNAAVQIMIIDAASIRAEPLASRARGIANASRPFGLREIWASLRRLVAGDPLADSRFERATYVDGWNRSNRRSFQTSRPSAPAVKLFLSSKGVSTGEAFEARVVNESGAPVELSGDGLVVEPLDARGQTAARNELRKAAAVEPAMLNAYCLEFLREPPTMGTLFRVASPELQKRFAPMRRILQAARKLQEAGLLNPDSSPADYFHSIKQWSVWSREQGFDLKSFGKAFVEHARKNFTAAGRQWTRQIEEAVLGIVPGRWRDIAQVLESAAPAAAGGDDAGR